MFNNSTIDIVFIISLTYVIIHVVSLHVFFEKNGYELWRNPFGFRFTQFTLFELAGLPPSYRYLLLIPFFNIYILYLRASRLAMIYGRTRIFGVVLFLFPPAGYFMLAFGKNKEMKTIYPLPYPTNNTKD